MKQAYSDKGWLRQFLPQPKPHQLHRFITEVAKMLDSYPCPTDQQISVARLHVYRSMMGVIK